MVQSCQEWCVLKHVWENVAQCMSSSSKLSNVSARQKSSRLSVIFIILPTFVLEICSSCFLLIWSCSKPIHLLSFPRNQPLVLLTFLNCLSVFYFNDFHFNLCYFLPSTYFGLKELFNNCLCCSLLMEPSSQHLL